MRLKNINVYYFINNRNLTSYSIRIIKKLIHEKANVFVSRIDNNFNLTNFKNLEKLELKIKNYYGNKIELSKKDTILIAPCSRRILGLIAKNKTIEVNQFLELILFARRKKLHIFIAPMMSKDLWYSQKIQQIVRKLENLRYRIIWPLINSKKTMVMCVGRIVDTICFSFIRINFLSYKVNNKELYKNLLFYRRIYFNDFKKIGKFLKTHKLNLPTAGCLSFKVPEGFIITSTGSDLSRLTPQNISLVIGFKEKINEIRWVGNNLPSSESPLNCIIHKKKKHKIVLHIHCPRLTYNYNLFRFCSKIYYRYGTFKIGYKAVELLRRDNFSILKCHGEVIIGNNVKSIKKTLINILKLA
jgi:ribulose-5-phosphate 4-epimerase/fuculose-1-phosphate aldolase